MVTGFNIACLGIFFAVCFVNGWDIQNVDLFDMNMKDPEHVKILASFISLQAVTFIVNTILLDS